MPKLKTMSNPIRLNLNQQIGYQRNEMVKASKQGNRVLYDIAFTKYVILMNEFIVAAQKQNESFREQVEESLRQSSYNGCLRVVR